MIPGPVPHGGNVEEIRRHYGIKKLLDFSANINPCAPFRLIRRGIIRSIPRVFTYPDKDYRSLTGALSGYLQINPSYILPGNGGADLIHHAAALINPRRSLVVVPAFGEYEHALGNCAFFPLSPREPRIDLRKLEEALTPEIEFLALGNPSNPLGCFYPLDVIRNIARLTASRGITLFVDEAFIDFIPEHREHSALNLLEQYPHLLVLRSLTKFFAVPGLRLGCLISSDQELIHRGKTLRAPWPVNALAAHTIPFLLARGQVFEKRRKKLEIYKDHLFYQLMTLPGITPLPSMVNFFTVKINLPVSSRELRKRMILEQGILIRDAGDFRGLNDTWFRVCVKKRQENNRLVNALKALSKCYI